MQPKGATIDSISYIRDTARELRMCEWIPRPMPPLRYHDHGRIPNHQFDSACKRPKSIMVSTSTSTSMMTYKADVLSVEFNAPRTEPGDSTSKENTHLQDSDNVRGV
jgi:hypothetical protein